MTKSAQQLMKECHGEWDCPNGGFGKSVATIASAERAASKAKKFKDVCCKFIENMKDGWVESATQNGIKYQISVSWSDHQFGEDSIQDEDIYVALLFYGSKAPTLKSEDITKITKEFEQAIVHAQNALKVLEKELNRMNVDCSIDWARE